MTSTKGKSLTSIEEYRCRARELIEPEGWSFYQGSAGKGVTYRDSEAAFERYVIRPRVLRDVTKRTSATTVLGQPISMPICVGPTACHRFAHPKAEIATAQGAASADTLYTQSMMSNETIAEVSRNAPGGLKWIDIYVYRNRSMTEHVIREAERAGYKAIVLTVDSQVLGGSSGHVMMTDQRWRYYSDPLLRPGNVALLDLPEIQDAIRSGDTNLRSYFFGQINGVPLTWDDVAWVKSVTSLPVVLKGILTGECARDAADAGMAGIIVSAHGGRHLDGAIAPLDALVDVVNAVKDLDIEVYMDGGVRSGTDVFKAIALGARAVFLGRPVLWGLACGGSTGVADLLSILRSEFDTALGLAGCTSPDDIPPKSVVRKSLL